MGVRAPTHPTPEQIANRPPTPPPPPPICIFGQGDTHREWPTREAKVAAIAEQIKSGKYDDLDKVKLAILVETLRHRLTASKVQ